jgi:hypothetical protein
LREAALAAGLEALLAEGRGAHLSPDPVLFPHRYPDRGDAEVAAFVAATFAFGGVLQIRGFLERLFGVLSPSPLAALTAPAPVPRSAVAGLSQPVRLRGRRPPFLGSWGRLPRTAGPWNGSTYAGYVPARPAPGPGALPCVVPARLGRTSPGRGNSSSPGRKRGSACKRHNLFLRWGSGKRTGDLSCEGRVAPVPRVPARHAHGPMGLTRADPAAETRTGGWPRSSPTRSGGIPEDPLRIDTSPDADRQPADLVTRRQGDCPRCPERAVRARANGKNEIATSSAT